MSRGVEGPDGRGRCEIIQERHARALHRWTAKTAEGQGRCTRAQGIDEPRGVGITRGVAGDKAEGGHGLDDKQLEVRNLEFGMRNGRGGK